MPSIAIASSSQLSTSRSNVTGTPSPQKANNEHHIPCTNATVPNLPEPAFFCAHAYDATHTDTFDMPYTSYVASLLAPPGAAATADQKIDFVHQQLDSFDHVTPIFDDLVLLGGGSSNRRQGGAHLVCGSLCTDTKR